MGTWLTAADEATIGALVKKAVSSGLPPDVGIEMRSGAARSTARASGAAP